MTPFPPLPLQEWEGTLKTLHLYAQIVGKIRLACAPPRNHWWHVTLHLSARGVTTGPMPYGQGTFEIEFDFVAHALVFRTSDGRTLSFALDGLAVARFYESVFASLGALGIAVSIHPKPYGVPMTEPFPTDVIHASYDKERVTRYWRILSQVDTILEEFSGRFVGKVSPVHLFWHSFDLAVTRFSGRRAPPRDMGAVAREAYSHECISFGFWAGDEKVPAPAFYSYTAPEPAGLAEQPLAPGEASWVRQNGGSLAIFMYDDMREAAAPKAALLAFLESAYQAGAKTAGWDIEGLKAG